MNVYRWKGIDSDNHPDQGMLYAEDPTSARSALRNQGILVRQLQKISTFRFHRSIRFTEITWVTRQLATFLTAGIPLVQSFALIRKNQRNLFLNHLLHAIQQSLEKGQSLTESLRRHPRWFDALFCSLIAVGEESGTLDDLLHAVTRYRERTERIKSRLKKALIYPAAVLTVALAVTAGLLVWVVPLFESLFAESHTALPALTRHVIQVSHWVNTGWPFLLMAVAGLSYFGARLSPVYLLKIPLAGRILNLSALARFACTLGITVSAGLPLMQALNITASATGNPVYEDAVKTVRDHVAQGQSLQEAMRRVNPFPELLIQFIAVGEESGKLDAMLKKAADLYDSDLATTLDTLNSLFEPVIMSLLGLLVGTLVVALYLPVFNLGSIL